MRMRGIIWDNGPEIRCMHDSSAYYSDDEATPLIASYAPEFRSVVPYYLLPLTLSLAVS